MEGPKTVKALLLDLDGTLLDLDGDEFMEAYIDAVAEWMRPLAAPARFKQAVWVAAVPLMVDAHLGTSNRDTLWSALEEELGVDRAHLKAHFDRELRRHNLGEILPGGRPMPGAVELVAMAHGAGLKLAVATMPIYPEIVIRERLRRCRLDGVPWDVITTEDMDAVKPDPAYWNATVRAAGVDAAECLVVGDDYFRDIRPAPAGASTFYVGPPFPGLNTGPGGTLIDLMGQLALMRPGASSRRSG